MSSKKRLNDLRVIDLRAECEKRNLDKSGVRGVLIQRLSKHLEDQGHDPETYSFDLPDTKTPTKRAKRVESSVEQETEETPAMEDMIVQDDAGEDEETEHKDADDKSNAEQSAEATMEVDEKAKTNRKRELKEDSEATASKKACLEKDKDDEQKIENNTDAEDSINLDIGDDELLNEEADNTTKPIEKGQEYNVFICKKEKVQDHSRLPLKQDFTARDRVGRSQRGERPALAQLTNNIGVDEAISEEPTEDAEEKTAEDSEPANDAAPQDEQQANSDVAATSNDVQSNEKEQKDEKDKDGDGEKKDKKDESKEGGARNLWVSGLSGDTRAKDLKQLCSKHGKVIGAKVVTNARTPGSRCYGYVTMATAQDAENCIKSLHRTELHGRMISVEKAKSESESASRRQPSRTERHSSKERKDDKDKDVKEPADKPGEVKAKKEGEVSGAESTRSQSREKSSRSDKEKAKRSTRSRERRRSPREVLSYNKIWKERDVARARERSRAAREEERRRRAAEEALRERERRQRLEKHRLALEREKLRAEREKIEREKNDLLRLERERHRLEREKLELERLELKRAQQRLEEDRRKRGYEAGAYRKAAASPPAPPPAPYERDARHKRPPPPPIASSRAAFEAPPPPRFEMPASYERSADKRTDRDRDYKRDYPPRHVSTANLKYSSNGGTTDDTRQPMPPGTRPKEPGRSYEARDRGSYRPSPPSKLEPRWSASSRYADSAAPVKSSGGGGGGGGSEAWSSSGGGGGGGESRYAGYEPRYPPQYQPPPPGATYPDRYAPQQRDYPRKY